MKLDTSDPEGRVPWNYLLFHAYSGLLFHSLIRPFPFLVDSVVQNQGWGQLQRDQLTEEPHMGY